VRLAIIGGKLQGVEAVYLAAKAGYETVLIDRRAEAPAGGLADVQHIFDVTADEEWTKTVLMTCDAVLPACEDEQALAWLAQRLPRWGIPFLFDPAAYGITSSKLASNQRLARLGVPRPRPWPDCGLPAVVKPSTASGSEGVRVVHDAQQLAAAQAALASQGFEVVVEEYVAGPSLSLEVVAHGGRSEVLQVTGLEFDHLYDCKRVTAPVVADPDLLAAFEAAAQQLAAAVQLDGVMDVEVMVRGSEPKVIEIDARLPSQTPTVVLHSCGINIVQMLAEAFAGAGLPAVDRTPRQAVVYQHLQAADGRLEVLGEHAVAAARPLSWWPGFAGADDCLTDYAPGSQNWVATTINVAADLATARRKAAQVVLTVADEFNLKLQPET
jgi:pyrrolysine biosynthesis protein PylC